MAKTRPSLTTTHEVKFGRRQTPIEIRTTHLLAGVFLRLTATFKVTGGSGAGTLLADGMYRLFQLIQFNTGGEPQMTWAGPTMRGMQQAWYPTNFEQKLPTSLAAGTTQAVELWLYIPFAQPHSYTSLDTALPTYVWPEQPPTITLDMAGVDVLASGNNGVITLENALIEVREDQLLDESLAPQLRDYMETFTSEKVMGAAAAREKMYLPNLQPGHEVRAVIVETFDANGLYTNSVVTHLRMLVSGTDVQEREEVGVLQQIDKRAYNLAALVPGFVFLDAAKDKGTELGELWYIAPGDRPYLEFACTGACMIRLTILAVSRKPFVPAE
jgi:hypothetical protein